MELWRVRIEAENAPGQLAAITRALAASDVNILSLDVHAIDGAHVADDLVVATPGAVDEADISGVLAPLEARVVDLRRADTHELVDSVSQALDAAVRVLADGADPDGLAAAIAQLVRCELSYVRPAAEVLRVDGIEGRAVAEDRPVLGRERLKLVPSGPDGAWFLALPTTLRGRPHVAVAARRSPRFSFTETARLRALLGVAAGAPPAVPARSGSESLVRLPDGGEIALRPLRASDEAALARMHRRCSPATMQRRYFSSMRELPATLLRLLLDVDGVDRTAVAAAVGSELVGVAHLTGLTESGDDGGPEVAVLVEDGHQRRGIGAALLHACAHEAVTRAVRSVAARCMADNEAFPTLVERCGYRVSQRMEDGQRLLTISLQRPLGSVAEPVDRRSHAARDHRLWWPR